MSMSIQSVTQTDTTNSWQDQWDQMLQTIDGMNAGEALMYIMYMMLPEVGDYLQGTLGSNADTQNDLSRIIGDMSDIQDQFNQGATGKVTNADAQQAIDDYDDIQSVLSSDPSLDGIAQPLTDQLEPLFQGGDASADAKDWNQAWKDSTSKTGSDADDSKMTTYTNAFSEASSTVTGESQTIQSQAQYIGDQLQEFFGEQGNICSSENSGVTVMVNNENTN